MVLSGKEVGSKVAIIGGGSVGVETAEFLADRGKKVTIIEMLERVATDLGPVVRMFQKQRLADNGIEIILGAKVSEIRDGEVVFVRGERAETVLADSVVIAVGYESGDGFGNIVRTNIPTHFIGDCRESGALLEAIHEGSLTGRMV